jgi:hypothetical protein
VYLLSADLLPAFFRIAKRAPPAKRPPTNAMITMGLSKTSEGSFPRYVDTSSATKVPKVSMQRR